MGKCFFSLKHCYYKSNKWLKVIKRIKRPFIVFLISYFVSLARRQGNKLQKHLKCRTYWLVKRDTCAAEDVYRLSSHEFSLRPATCVWNSLSSVSEISAMTLVTGDSSEDNNNSDSYNGVIPVGVLTTMTVVISVAVVMLSWTQGIRLLLNPRSQVQHDPLGMFLLNSLNQALMFIDWASCFIDCVSCFKLALR